MINDNRQLWIRRGVLAASLFVILVIVWQVVKRPFVQVELPEGADTLVLTKPGEDGKLISTKITKTSRVRLATGGYDAAYYKEGKTVGLHKVSISPSPWQSLKGSVSTPTHKLQITLHQHAALVTPLGNGYLYLNTETRGVEYIDKAGITDLSSSLFLSSTPSDPDLLDYSTAIAIQSTKDGHAVITTTTGVFVAKSPTDIVRLPSSTAAILNFTSSSYDAVTNRVFLLSSYSHQVYFYDLGKPKDGPKVIHSASKDINRITAGGGKFAVYFDDVPSVEPAVLKAYGTTRELAPTIVAGDNGKVLKTLDDWQGVTQVSISDDGAWIALKKKFATSMTLQSLTGNDTHTVAASDMNAIAWRGNTMYFGRDKSLWSVNPSTTGDKIQLVASTDSDISALVAHGDTMLVTSPNNFISTTVAADIDTSARLGAQLRKLDLKDKGYYIAYIAGNTDASVVIEGKGIVGLGTTEEELSASVNEEYQNGLAALGQHATNPAISIQKKDTSISVLYQYAGIPTDGQQ